MRIAALLFGTVARLTVPGSYDERVADWTPDDWAFAPTVLYGGNRFRILKDRYPPVIAQASPDMPITMTDVYRLSTDGRPATVEFLAGDTSAPMFGWWRPHEKKGVLILAEPFTSAGETGFMIAEDPARHVCSFSVSAPGFRSRAYRMCRFVSPSGDVRPAVTNTPLSLIRCEFAAQSVAEFLEEAFTRRKAMTGPTVPPDIEPFGFLADRLFETADRRAWYEDANVGYILNWPPGPESPYAHLQVGWCGAPPYAVPFLLRPTPERLRRVGRTFDALVPMAGKSGFFRAMNRRGELLGDCFGKIDQPMRTMTRRQTSAVMAGFDALRLLRRSGVPVRDAWVVAFRNAAEALMRLWRRQKDLGQFVDAETGALLVPNSTNGALAPAALLSAADYLNEPSFVSVAEEIAADYRVRFLARGFSCGGPAEAAQCPDSESAGELLVSFERLWEKTGKAEWLDAARTAAALVATWVNAYDYSFPPTSMFGRMGIRSTGAVWASVQNRHGAPGHFHYGNGDVLFRLWRATGDERVWELMTDTARGVGQYVHTGARPFFPEGEEPGSISERVNTGDWEERRSIGLLTRPNDFNMVWATTALSHMLEVPGVYVLADGDLREVRTLDRVSARIADASLVLENRTAFDTCVSVLAETRETRHRPLGPHPSVDWLRVPMRAGETVSVPLTKCFR